MKIALVAIAISLALVGALVFVGMQLSVQSFLPRDGDLFAYDNTSDARLWRGSLQVLLNRSSFSAPAQIDWTWCPLAGLTTWCVNLVNGSMHASGRVALAPNGDLHLRGVEFQLPNLEILGLAPELAAASISGTLTSARISEFGCPLRASELNMEMQTPALFLMQANLGRASARLEPAAGGHGLVIEGDGLDGRFDVGADLRYLGEGIITPPLELQQLFNALATPLGGGRYSWRLQGAIPC